MTPDSGFMRTQPARPYQRLRSLAVICLFASGMFVLQRLTFTLRLPPYDRTTVWTPGALVFAALLLTSPRCWWKYYLGMCLGVFSAYYGDRAIPHWIALLAAQFHFLAVVLGVTGLRRWSDGETFGSIRWLMVYLFFAGIVVPFLTTGPIDLVRWYSGADNVLELAIRSFLCISLGVTLGTPAFYFAVRERHLLWSVPSYRRLAEVLIVFAALIVVSHFAFSSTPGTAAVPALMYSPLPFLLWAAMRFGVAGTSWAMIILSFQSTWNAIQGRGPFGAIAPTDNVLQLQCFLLSLSVPLMFLASAVSQQRTSYMDLARSQSELEHQFAQLTTIYRTAPVGLSFLDTKLRFVRVNAVMARLTGVSEDDHAGRTLKEIPSGLICQLEPICQQVLESRSAYLDHELVGPRTPQGGHPQVWLASCYPVRDSAGKMLGVSTVLHDVTAQKRAEEVRQQLTHASRLALVGEFTASIAHEINQPLGAIMSNADAAEILLEQSSDTEGSESLTEVHQIIEDIRRDSLRVNEVIQRLRNLLRRNELEVEPVNLRDTIPETLKLIQAEANRRLVTIETRFADDLPSVPANRVHLQQVIVNLCLNSFESMEVCSDRRTILVTTGVAEQWVEITVEDNGPGIPAESLHRVFEAFFTTKPKGLGLGLAISQTLIEAHGGQLSASNRPEGGALFQIRLPIRNSFNTAVSASSQLSVMSLAR